mgnify:CR=1 FL=1
MLNETLENISDCGLEDDMLTALFKVNSDRDEVMEAIENAPNISAICSYSDFENFPTFKRLENVCCDIPIFAPNLKLWKQ